MEGCTYSSIADEYASFTVKHYARATVVFDGYEVGPSIKDCTHQRRSRHLNANKVNITGATKFVGKKEDCLSNEANKQAIIQLIMERLRQRGCEVIQAEGDADVDDIAKSSRHNICFQIYHPRWRRHGSHCTLALPCCGNKLH